MDCKQIGLRNLKSKLRFFFIVFEISFDYLFICYTVNGDPHHFISGFCCLWITSLQKKYTVIEAVFRDNEIKFTKLMAVFRKFEEKYKKEIQEVICNIIWWMTYITFKQFKLLTFEQLGTQNYLHTFFFFLLCYLIISRNKILIFFLTERV